MSTLLEQTSNNHNHSVEMQTLRAAYDALVDGTRALLHFEDFETAAREIFATCKKITGATSGYVALLSSDGTENQVLFLDSGGRPCTVDENLPMPIRGLREVAYRTRKATYDNSFARSHWARYMPEGHMTLDNVLFAPLVIGGQAVGLIGLANKPGGFDQRDLDLVSALGNIAAVALNNSINIQHLRDSEKTARFLTENMTDIVWTMDLGLRRTYVSPSVETVLGFTVEESLEQTLEQTVASGSLDRVIEVFNRELERVRRGDYEPNHAMTIEAEYYHKNGSMVWLESRCKLLLDEQGEPAGVYGVSRDISDRKEAERALQESETKYRLLIENSHDIIYRITTDGHFTFASPSWTIVLGYPLHRVVGRSFQDFVHPDDIPVCAQFLQEVVKTGRRREGVEYRVRHQDGSWRWHTSSATPLFGDAGRVTGYVGIARDITDRKQAEEALQARLEFERLLSALSSHFVNLPAEDLNAGIHQALQATGEFFRVDRSYLFQFSTDGNTMSCTHEWCATGIEPQRESLQDLPVDDLPWWSENIRAGQRIHIPDVDRLPPEAKVEQAEFQRQDIKSLLCLPLRKDDRTLGFYGFDAVREQRKWTEDQAFLLNVIAELITSALLRHQSEEQVRRLSFFDPLTGLYNRRYFVLELERLAGSREYPIAIISADLDGLKLVNDTLGHQAGDRSLEISASLMKESLRSCDLLARVGGDEFALILPRTGLAEGERLVDRIHRRIDKHNQENSAFPIHLSIGLAVSEHRDQPLKDTYQMADKLMYQDKSVRGENARHDIAQAIFASLAEQHSNSG